MKQLIENVVQWGKDRGLDKVGHLAQAKYTLKKTAELLDAYADGDVDKINDAIGDILVTLIVGASNDDEILQELTELILTYKYKPLPVQDLDFFDHYEKLIFRSGMLYKYQNYNNYQDFYVTLFWLCSSVSNLSFQDCLQLAYDEIKNRTGKLVDGQFIKD